MKSYARLLRERFKAGHFVIAALSYILFALTLGILTTTKPFLGQTGAENLLGGIERSQIRGDINYLQYTRWLLILGFPLIWVSLISAQIKHSFLYTFLRIKKANTIWHTLCSEVFAHVFVYVLSLSLANSFVVGRWAKDQWIMTLLILIHLSLISIIALRMILMHSYRTIPAALILLAEGITFFISQRWIEIAPFLPGTWSMYLQSSLAVKDGFSAPLIVLIEIAAILVLCFHTPCLGSTVLREAR